MKPLKHCQGVRAQGPLSNCSGSFRYWRAVMNSRVLKNREELVIARPRSEEKIAWKGESPRERESVIEEEDGSEAIHMSYEWMSR